MTLRTTLRDETRALYNARPKHITPTFVAAEIKASTQWLRLFAAGEIDNPGVNTVESLNHLLKKVMNRV